MDTNLERIAEEEILREARRAVARAEVSGIEGFKKNPLPSTNKRFLTNTILNNMKSNRFKETQQKKNTRFQLYRHMEYRKNEKNYFKLESRKMLDRSLIVEESSSKAKESKKGINDLKCDLKSEIKRHSIADIKSRCKKKNKS